MESGGILDKGFVEVPMGCYPGARVPPFKPCLRCGAVVCGLGTFWHHRFRGCYPCHLDRVRADFRPEPLPL